MGLSLVYAFAENEVMKDVLSRQLFGTLVWLTTQQPWPEMHVHENGSDGRYSPWDGKVRLRVFVFYGSGFGPYSNVQQKRVPRSTPTWLLPPSSSLWLASFLEDDSYSLNPSSI